MLRTSKLRAGLRFVAGQPGPPHDRLRAEDAAERGEEERCFHRLVLKCVPGHFAVFL